MDNRDLFKFEFSDRRDEKRKLHHFFENFEEKTLWIYGKSGTGKSFFVNECLKQIPNFKPIYVENPQKATDGYCVYRLIEEMQLVCQKNFFEFVQKHYSFMSDIVSNVTNKEDLKSTFLKYVFSKNQFFVDKNNGYNDLAEILASYLKKVLSDGKIVFVIDNINRCDENSFGMLLNFVKQNVDNSNCRFIFISTDSENKNQQFDTDMQKELPFEYLSISQIPDEVFFINMLPIQFDITNLSEEDILIIYNYCQGLPEKLQDLLANLDKQNAIKYSDKRIEFRRCEMKHYISTNPETSLDFTEYLSAEECILLVIICIATPISLKVLHDISLKLHEQLFGIPLPESEWNASLRKLQPKPLKNYCQNGAIYLYTDHDLSFSAALSYFDSIGHYQMACSYIYKIIKENPQVFMTDFHDAYKINELYSDLTFHAKDSEWKHINYDCGELFFNIKNYTQANKYYSRLESHVEELDSVMVLHLGITAYEVGEYFRANQLLLLVDKENVLDKYELFIYIGKSYNMIPKVDCAISYFQKAISVSEKNTDNWIYAKYLKHLVMFQNPKYKEEAQKGYKELVSKIQEAHEKHDYDYLYQLSNAKLLKCCYEYYYNDTALKLFEIAEEIVQHCGDNIEEAYILHNKGFEYIRQDQTEKAHRTFLKAYKIMKNTKRHDASYSLNNIAICKMFNGQYSEAIDDLKKALLYQNSYYLQLTAETMLMQCYRLNNDDDQFYRLQEKLATIISEEKYDDPAIIRKLCSNLAICEFESGMTEIAKKYVDLIFDNVRGTSSEYRIMNLHHQLYDISEQQADENGIFKNSKYFNCLKFDPWFITLSHD